MFPSNKVCPRCKCGACYPLHRKGIDWLVYLVGLRPARCITCSRKFYMRYTIDVTGAKRSAVPYGRSAQPAAPPKLTPSEPAGDRRHAA